LASMPPKQRPTRLALLGSPTTSAFAPLLGNKRTSNAPLPSFLIY